MKIKFLYSRAISEYHEPHDYSLDDFRGYTIAAMILENTWGNWNYAQSIISPVD